MRESIKASEIKTSTLFNLVFANNVILSCFSSFLFFDLYFLIPAVIAEILNSVAELVLLIGMPKKGIRRN